MFDSASASIGSLVAAAVANAEATMPTCQAAGGQLTWKCGGLCGDYVPCIVFNASSTCDDCVVDEANKCQYWCFPQAYDGAPSFQFLIPFGTRARQDPFVAAYEAGAPKAADAFPSADNFSLISTMQLASNCSSVSFSGGSRYNTTLVGHVVEMDFARELLAQNTQVQEVLITSINLQPVINDFATMFPPYVTSMTFRNNNISSFDTDLQAAFPVLSTLELLRNSLKSFAANHSVLEYIDMSWNELSAFDAVLPKLNTLILAENELKLFAADFPALKKLDLTANNLSSFTANLPQLTNLNLANNHLTSFPASIFNSTGLVQMNLTGNPLKDRNVSSAEADFLSRVTLDISNADFSDDGTCGDSEQRWVTSTLFVCVTDSDSNTSSSNFNSPASTNTPSPEKQINSGKLPDTGLVVGLAGGSAALVLLFGLVFARIWFKRSKRDTSFKDNDLAKIGNNHLGSLWNDAELSSLRVDADDIEDVKQLGAGSFGVVWLVKYRNNERLASKRLLPTPTTENFTTSNNNSNDPQRLLHSFIAEIKLVARLRHPSIVRFVGVAWKYHNDLQALFEFMEHGDLRDYLIATAASGVGEWGRQKIRMALDVVGALVYVHSFEPPVVHRDIKARNVLLTSRAREDSGGYERESGGQQLRAKLTDFGVARNQSEQSTMTAAVGTGRWIAPEVLAGSSHYGPSADMYSFGVLLSELDTHAIPYESIMGGGHDGGNPRHDRGRECSDINHGKNVVSNIALLQLVASGELRPSFHARCPAAIRELAGRCLSFDPEKRPTAVQVHFELRSM